MNIFKKNEINQFNVGDKFNMPVELIKIEKNKDGSLSYLLKTLLSGSSEGSNIYGINSDDLNKMEKI